MNDCYHKENVMEQSNMSAVRKLSDKVEKAFRSAKVGDEVAFLTYKEEGGIYKVTNRHGIRGHHGTITLTLEREYMGKKMSIELDMYKDGPGIAVMGLLRTHKKRGRRPGSKSTPPPAMPEGGNSQSDGSQAVANTAAAA
jgi:hypothetical protein